MASAKDLVTQGVWPAAATMLADDQFNTFPTVAVGSALTVNPSQHLDKVILLDTAAGSTVTLPAASGTGNVYRFKVSVSVTSNAHIVKVANATDIMRGTMAVSGTTGTVFASLPASDSVSMNGTTSGGLIGTEITVVDYAAGVFKVSGFSVGSGTIVTPFATAVS